MTRFLLSTATFLAANAIGLLVAALVLSGFAIDPLSFIITVLVFSLVQSVLEPMMTRLSKKRLPQLIGGIALITIFAGLFLTDLLMEGMQIGGVANWLAATLLVWLGSLVSSILLPIYVFRQRPSETGKSRG